MAKVVTRFRLNNGYYILDMQKLYVSILAWLLAWGSVICGLMIPIRKEEQEYIRAIQEDIKWLGFDWGDHLYYASDYFEQMYHWAIELIKAGKPMWMISVPIRSGSIAVH